MPLSNIRPTFPMPSLADAVKRLRTVQMGWNNTHSRRESDTWEAFEVVLAHCAGASLPATPPPIDESKQIEAYDTAFFAEVAKARAAQSCFCCGRNDSPMSVTHMKFPLYICERCKRATDAVANRAATPPTPPDEVRTGRVNEDELFGQPDHVELWSALAAGHWCRNLADDPRITPTEATWLCGVRNSLEKVVRRLLDARHQLKLATAPPAIRGAASPSPSPTKKHDYTLMHIPSELLARVKDVGTDALTNAEWERLCRRLAVACLGEVPAIVSATLGSARGRFTPSPAPSEDK